MEKTPGVVDVDWYVEDDQPKYRFVVDKEKAALSGVSEAEIVRALAHGRPAARPQGSCTTSARRRTCRSCSGFDRATRSDLERLQGVRLAGRERQPRQRRRARARPSA